VDAWASSAFRMIYVGRLSENGYDDKHALTGVSGGGCGPRSGSRVVRVHDAFANTPLRYDCARTARVQAPHAASHNSPNQPQAAAAAYRR